MGRSPVTAQQFEFALQRAAANLRKYGPSKLPVETRKNPCEFVVATPHNSNGKKINVRCRCMAPYGARPRYFAYDTIAVVTNIQDAVTAWKRHVKEVSLVDPDSQP